MAKKKLQTLTVDERSSKGKGPNRRLRKQGIVPGIYYDQKGANLMVQVAELPLVKLWQKVGGAQVFNLIINREGDSQELPSLVWRVKYDPVKPKPIHVDFFGVDLDKELKVSVAFEFAGKAKGVVEGGQQVIYRDSVEVICKPMDIPEHLVVDVTELDINETISIEDVEFPEGVQGVFDENYSIVGIIVPTEVEEPGEEELEGEEGAEGEEESGESGDEEAQGDE